MRSRNPAFNRMPEFSSQGGNYATFRTPQQGDMSAQQLDDMYAAPTANAMQTGRMTLDDVIMRTAALFAVLLLAALPTYFYVERNPQGYSFVLVGMFVALALNLVNSFKKTPSPPLMFAFAVAEGVFVGGISSVYANFSGDGSGIIFQAILATLCTFGAMLVLYKAGVIRNSPKFTKIMVIAMAGYFVFALIHLLGVMFGWWANIYAGGGMFPILLSAFGAVLASLTLVLDFDFIEQGLANGLPKVYAWSAGYGLMVTLVWMYLEILRLIALLNRD